MRLQCAVYRAHNPLWAHDPLSGAGAARHGGRFNRPGIPALYTSLRFETAWLEAQQGFVRKTQPLTLCAYDVDCDRIADLTGPLFHAPVPPADLACAWEAVALGGGTPPSWAAADRIIADGYAGIIVQSYAVGATADDKNVVFWKWSAALPHRVVLIDDHGRIPTPPR